MPTLGRCHSGTVGRGLLQAWRPCQGLPQERRGGPHSRRAILPSLWLHMSITSEDSEPVGRAGAQVGGGPASRKQTEL